jgi:hypothetical protein
MANRWKRCAARAARDTSSRSALRAIGAPTISLLIALSSSGCTNYGPASGSLAASAPRGPTIAFESIDGPPPAVFRRLVQNLEVEADLREVAVVSREGSAQYRIRGYLAAKIEHRQVAFVWVWDLYDGDGNRTLRMSGEEKAGPVVRDAWAAADDQVLRRIARAGINELAAFAAAPPGTQRPPGPERAPAIAGADPGAPSTTLAALPPHL